MSDFTHLHVHTEYSLLDGLTTPEELAAVVAKNNQKACAITDHGTMAGALRFQNAAKKYGFNPIFGCEFYFVPSLKADDKDKAAERYHLILLAKNDEGLKKLFTLQRRSWTHGFYYKPRIEFDDLILLGGDVVCLSGCMGSYICQRVLEGRLDKAEFGIDKFASVFGNDFYIELQPWNPPLLNDTLMSMAIAKNIEVVGTIDAHYPTCDAKGVEEVLLAIGQQNSMTPAQKRHLHASCDEAAKVHDLVDKMDILFPNRRLSFKEHDVYVMGSDEVRQRFADLGLTDNRLLSNSMVIADKCGASIRTGISLLPQYMKDKSSEELLREKASFGLSQRLPAHADDGLRQTYWNRLNSELQVIQKLNFSDYFLIIQDIVDWAKANDIAMGHSRGSVGGSLVAYMLGITNIDPIKFNLLFSRFINEERNDFPDIDLDFEDARRGEVKEYIKTKWGQENVASISTFGEYKPKSTVKDVARMFGLPFAETNDLTSKFETIEEFESADWAKELLAKQPDLVSTAKSLSGRIRNAGAHAAGVVISSQPLSHILPIESRNDRDGDSRVEVTAFTMDECAEIGLIKIDILGVKAVKVVKDAIDAVYRGHRDSFSSREEIVAQSTALNDPKVYQAFTDGNLTGIFQAEASAYRHLIAEMGIDNFNDLVASNALVRPGAMTTQGASYVARKMGKEDVAYPHPMLESILQDTYGKFLYQEQLMQTAVELAGFSWSEADYLRKIIGKKRDSADFEPYRVKFVDGASRHISRHKAEYMWQDFEKSSTYMFNKSHAVGYSMLSYQTMWLKVHYPTEFIWASLRNENNKTSISGFLMEARRLSIPVKSPDVSYSDDTFTMDKDGNIRFGLVNVAGCGPNAAKEIISKRPYRSLDHFLATTSKRAVSKKLVENLDKVGAFESLGHISSYDHSSYYLPILSYAIDDSDNDVFTSLYTKCADAERQDGWHIVKGLVKGTTRKVNYFRVEIEDDSGMIYGFCNDINAEIKKGDYIIAMFCDSNIAAFVDATTIFDNDSSPMVQFMKTHMLDKKWYTFAPETNSDRGVIGVILQSKKIRTKSGYTVCSVDYWDGSQILRANLYEEVFDENFQRLSQFGTVVLKLRPGKRIDRVIDVRTLPEYAKIKGISVDVLISGCA